MASVNLGTVLASVAACNKTSAFPPNLIIQWIEVGWTGDHSLLVMKLWRSDLMKIETENVKMMGTPRKLNAILLNIKVNRPKLVSMCRYKLATYWQNFMEIFLTWVKILQKVLGGYFFDSRCICKCQPQTQTSKTNIDVVRGSSQGP